MGKETFTNTVAIKCDDKHLASLLGKMTTIIQEQMDEYQSVKMRLAEEQEISKNLKRDLETSEGEVKQLNAQIAMEKVELKKVKDNNFKITESKKEIESKLTIAEGSLNKLEEFQQNLLEGKEWLESEKMIFKVLLEKLGNGLKGANERNENIPNGFSKIDFNDPNAFVERCKNGLDEGFIFLCNIVWWYENTDNSQEVLEPWFDDLKEMKSVFDILLTMIKAKCKWEYRFPEKLFKDGAKPDSQYYQSSSEKCKWYSKLFPENGIKERDLCEISKMATDGGQMGLLREYFR